MKLRTLILGAALGLALCLPLAPGMAEEAVAADMQITSIDQLEPFVPDDIFRQAIFDAVKNGADGAEGKDVVEALYNFRGTVKYNKSSTTPSDQKIKDVHGIEYLRNAELVSLKYNEISDFSWLEKDPTTDEGKKYYGELLAVDPDIGEDARNVVWDFSGNPFEKLPADFGGCLKIEQPAASSYTYPEDVSQHVVCVRPADDTAVDGILDIKKTEMFTNGTKSRDAKVVECTPTRKGDLPTKLAIDSFDDATANFSKLEKSGVFHVYVGLEKELVYATQDEWGEITDGAQSFKYYITPTFRIYDRITAASTAGSSAQLTKTDAATGAAVAGASYAVYTHDGTLLEERTTDAAGVFTTSDLLPGDYYFQETSAPDGYLVNDEKIPFTIAEGAAKASTAVGGGETSVTASDGQTVNAEANERLFAGGRLGSDGTGDLMSPELTLSSSDSDDIANVKVTYSKLDSGDNVVRTFDTLAAAQADINAEKASNTILGPVSVTAAYHTSSADPVIVTTTDKAIPTITIPVTKKWQDNPTWNGTRKPVDIYLWCEGTQLDTWHLVGTKPAHEEGDTFTHEFTNLPATDQQGNKLTYTVTEGPVEDSYGTFTSYLSTIESVSDDPADGFVVSNIFNDDAKFPLTGKKTWSGDQPADRPESVSLTLTQTNAAGHAAYVFTTTAEAADDWAYTFTNVPLWEVKPATDGTGGTRAVYELTETPVSGYASFDPVENIQGTNDAIPVSIGSELTTNTLKPQPGGDTVEVAGTKTWVDNDNAGNTRPETLVVSLYQNDKLFGTQETSAQDDWAYRFADLPRLDADGKEFAYSIREDVVPSGYTATVKGYDLTNTLSEIPQKPKDPTTPTDTPRKPAAIGSAPHKLVATGDTPLADVAMVATVAAAALAIVSAIAFVRKRRRA